MRICSISFKDQVKVQVDNKVKTMKPGQNLEIIELGHVDSYGRDHLCGIMSNQVVNITPLKQQIGRLDDMNISNKLEWFQQNYPNASVIKIESSKIYDKLQKDVTEIGDKSVVVNGSFELKWGN